MIQAEILNVNGKDWIKVTFRTNPTLHNAMIKVIGARYNALTNAWSVPVESLMDFQEKMSDYLIVWKDEEFGSGGIDESKIPSEPVMDGYSVTYDSDRNIIASEGFKTRPFGEFQVKGFNLMYKRNFLILADEMGLGKSWTAINAMEARIRNGVAKRGVVICKASLIFNWRDEILMHSDCVPVAISGTVKRRMNLYAELKERNDWSFIIVSYDTFKRDVNNFQYLDTYKELDFLIVDESHVIKNPESRIGHVVHYIPFKARYLLTATPLPNSPLESYNYLKLGGKVNINWWDFKNRYAVWGGRNNKEIMYYKNMAELRQAIQVNMLRRLKKDKLKELPDIVFREIRVPMSAKQTKLYTAVKKEILEDLRDTSLEKLPSAMAKLLRLQQITDSPAIIGAEDADSSKLLLLDDMLEELIEDGGQKVIVFSRFKTVVEMIQTRYAKYNPAVIHGDVDANGRTAESAKRYLKRIHKGELDSLTDVELDNLMQEAMSSERQREVYKFQQDESCKLFIGCAPACREGLTLTKSTHVIFIDVEWSWDYVAQAFSRAHRIGQKNAVTVHFLLCEDTVDEHTLRVVKRKRTMSESMLGGDVSDSIDQSRAREFIAEMLGTNLADLYK